MSFLQALRSFFRDAVVNLVRGWKVSLVAVLTIAVSLFLSGVFLLASRNLARSVERWQRLEIAYHEALADQFTLGGTDGLENQLIWQTPDVSKAGGLKALAAVGEPRKMLQEIKERMFAA